MAVPPVPLLVVGAGGHGREVLDIIEAQPEPAAFRVIGFLSAPRDDEELLRRRGHRILGDVEAGSSLVDHHVLAVGWSATRRAVAERLTGVAVSLTHPAAWVDPSTAADAGPGLVLAAGARLGGGGTVGAHVHLNTNAVVEADVHLGSFTTVSPGAVVGHGARLEAGCLVGAGARVRPGVHLGEGCVVGAGAVVEVDAPPGSRLVGVPARVR